MLGLILPFLQSILPNILNRVLPAEKMSEEDKAKIQQELTLALLTQDWKQVEAEYADIASARNLAEVDISHGNAFTTMLSSIVRPIWGIGGFMLVSFSWYKNVPIDPAMQDIITVVLQFYFGGKIVEAVTPHLAEAIATFGRK